jgi:hypothetical protein
MKQSIPQFYGAAMLVHAVFLIARSTAKNAEAK